MRALVRLVLAAMLAVAARAAGADPAAGTATASFLTIGSGASVLAMSGATLASGQDLAAAAWNPATLARLEALQFALAHTPLPGGATQDWLSMGGRLRGGETRWAIQTVFHQEGDLEARDASNVAVGSLSVSDLAFAARLARPWGESFSVGAGAEYVRESLAGVTGAGLAFEAGVRAHAGPFGVALAARHIGGDMRYSGVRYDLPAMLAVGVSWQDAARGVRLALDLESPTHDDRDVRLGGEWRVHDRVALRAGYRHQMGETGIESRSGPSFGMGTGVGPMWLDYAFMPSGADQNGAHRVGLTFHPGLPGRGGSEGGARMRAPSSSPEAPPDRAGQREVVMTPKPAPTVVAPKPRDEAGPQKASPQQVQAAQAVTPERIVTPRVPPPVVEASEPQRASASAPQPSAKPGIVVSSQPPSRPPSRPLEIVVGEGETLAMLARRWSVSVPALMMANNLVRERAAVGTRLRLPPAKR